FHLVPRVRAVGAIGPTGREPEAGSEQRPAAPAAHNFGQAMEDGNRTLRVLAVSDEVDSRLYGNNAWKPWREAPQLLLGCGDVPPYYLDYLVSRFDVPLYAIHGNHDAPPPLEGSGGFDHCGASWIGGRAVRVDGLLLAGFDGSLRYNAGAYQ